MDDIKLDDVVVVSHRRPCAGAAFWRANLMRLNCRPGDLAVVVQSVAGNEGKIVTCLNFVGSIKGFSGDDYWIIDRPLPSRLGNIKHFARDSRLRPLRDSEGEDEMLRIAGLPQPINADKECAR